MMPALSQRLGSRLLFATLPAEATPPVQRRVPAGDDAGQTEEGGIRRGRGLLLLLGILLLAAALRLYGLASFPFEQDELYTLRDAVAFGEKFSVRPVYYALQHVLLYLHEPTPFYMRLPPFLFGVLGVGMTWVLARRVFGTTAAHLAALMVALSPWHLGASQFARYYTLLYLLAAGLFLVLLRTMDEGRPRDYLLALLLFPLGALTHPTFLFPMVGVVLGLHLVTREGRLKFRWPSRTAWMHLWLPLLGAALVALLALLLTGREDKLWNRDGRGLLATLRLIPAMVQWMSPEIAAAALAGVAFLLLAARQSGDRRWGAMALLGCFSAVGILFVLSFRTDVYADYAMSMLPLVYVSIGGFVQRVGEAMAFGRRAFALAAAFLLTVGVLPGTVSHLSDGTRFDYRPAYAYLEQHGGGRLVVGEPIVLQRHYAPGLPLFEEPAMSAAYFEEALERTGGFWYVASFRRYGLLLDDGSVEPWVDAHCRKVLQTQRPRLDYRTYRVELLWCGDGPPPGAAPAAASAAPPGP